MSDDKLQQAIAAIRSGDKQAGHSLLVEIIKANPRNENAWLWMASLVDSDSRRKQCLEQVLAINPDNQIAKKGLAALQQRQVDIPQTETPPKPVESLPNTALKPLPAKQPPSATRMQWIDRSQLEVQPEQGSPAPPSVKKSKSDTKPVKPVTLQPLKREPTRKCPYCAETIKAEAIVCRFCGRDLRTGQHPKQAIVQPQPMQVYLQTPPQRFWSPGLAALLTFIIPGAGQMYKGQVGRGILYLLLTAIGYGFFIIPGLIFHILIIFEAASGDPYKRG